MKTFHELLKETNKTMRRARAYTDSLISNAEKLAGILSNDAPNPISDTFIVIAAKNALDKKNQEYESIVEASNRVAVFEPMGVKENLYKLLLSYSLQIDDAWSILNLLYQKYLNTRSQSNDRTKK